MTSRLLFTAAMLGGLAVLLGALGAHALKPLLAPSRLDAFETAVRYQMVHALALLAIHALDPAAVSRHLRRAAILFIAGIVCFCGSIYGLAMQDLAGIDLRWLGPVTPAGGVLLAAGWGVLAWHALRPNEKQ